MREKIALAVRVLDAIQHYVNPVQSDLENLRSWVPEEDRGASASEQACIVIMAELQVLKDKQTIANGSGHQPTFR